MGKYPVKVLAFFVSISANANRTVLLIVQTIPLQERNTIIKTTFIVIRVVLQKIKGYKHWPKPLLAPLAFVC